MLKKRAVMSLALATIILLGGCGRGAKRQEERRLPAPKTQTESMIRC